MSQDSLFNTPPSQEEQRIIHDFFIKTVDHKVNYDGISTCSSCKKKNIVRRQAMSEDSLFNTPPSQEEQRIIHDFFIKTVDHKVNYDRISTSTGSLCKKNIVRRQAMSEDSLFNIPVPPNQEGQRIIHDLLTCYLVVESQRLRWWH
jgi:hypothetical protein